MKVNGNLVKQYRREKGLTQGDLSKGICTPEMIRQIEHNEALPSDEVVQKIANKLGVPLAALQGQDE